VSAGPARVRIRAVPGSRSAGVVGRYGEAWKVRVRSAPEAGRANDELAELLAQLAGVRARDVRVIAGTGARDKLVEVAGCTTDTLEAALQRAAAGGA
jgi:uncharacterized protein YggU (UPF0235/DUF167 family)